MGRVRQVGVITSVVVNGVLQSVDIDGRLLSRDEFVFINGQVDLVGETRRQYDASRLEYLAAQEAKRRITYVCGAKTRDGSPCKRRSMDRKRRCRLHGGKSTGACTEAGRAAIAESNRRRAKAKVEKGSLCH